MESAASLLGLAQRIPEQEVVALPAAEPFPKALAGQWRHVRIALPERGATVVEGLSSWNLEGLLVGIAARPSSYRDVAGLGQWLADAGRGADVEALIALLAPMGAATSQRVAYPPTETCPTDARSLRAPVTEEAEPLVLELSEAELAADRRILCRDSPQCAQTTSPRVDGNDRCGGGCVKGS
jgi:AbiEi antitoxin C-terminal domain